jgi:hypothetical protein
MHRLQKVIAEESIGDCGAFSCLRPVIANETGEEVDRVRQIPAHGQNGTFSSSRSFSSLPTRETIGAMLQLLPSQCSMKALPALLPTAQASLCASAETAVKANAALRVAGAGVGTSLHWVPFQWIVKGCSECTPSWFRTSTPPTAQTSLADEALTELRKAVWLTVWVPDWETLQVLPFQCSMRG